jgi:two-component system, OmpR family, sensor histidine kinase VicK
MKSEYESLERIGALSANGVFIFDLGQQGFLYMNDAFAAIFGVPKKTLMNQPALVMSCIHSEDTFHLRGQLRNLQERNSISNAEFRLHLDNGSFKHLTCDVYKMGEGAVVAGFVKDVTKEKEHEDYIINYGAKKDTLLDMMTHNLSGPLHLTSNILKWVKETYRDQSPGDIQKQLLLIEDNTRHCLDIISDFLKQEHLESEKIYVKKTRFDILERLIATLDKLIAANRNKQFRLITNLVNLNINTDSVKFFQIVHNLVSNAIKFTPENGQIDILLEEKETTFVLKVRDNGIGIPSQLQRFLFERRTPSGRNGLDNEASTGMGLSIVKALTELLGGKVEFSSEKHKGSVFSVELPKE